MESELSECFKVVFGMWEESKKLKVEKEARLFENGLCYNLLCRWKGSIDRQVQHGTSCDGIPSQNAKQHHVAGRPSSVKKGISMCLMAHGKAF